ncbi:MAG: multidrug efflux RND transporter permease subunit [Bacteroidales bacterium]|nr:multidrug efflux RND transporter permease subunit [Bacteroidales bacterium]
MISRFFIDRPVFANVIAIITVLFGTVAMFRLPVEQYPPITPPTVVATTNYPGADAEVVADTVAAPIEQQVNGVENMIYMSSTCSADGGYSLTVTFKIGTNLDDAQVLVQNRLAAAEASLPDEVRRQGVTVKKQSTNIICGVSLTSEDGTYDGLFLSNYATLRIRDELSRVKGVGEVMVRGQGAYAMRVWLDPTRLKARGLTTNDVAVALRGQNVQVAAGQVGQRPNHTGEAFQYTVTTTGRLSDPEQFEQIILKTGVDGRITYLRDVARVELGAQNYDSFSSRSGMLSATILVYQLPESNALEVTMGVRAKMQVLARDFPPGLEYTIPFDTTKFVDAAITAVYTTLLEAGVLVLIVIMVFLQSWRALLVPATTVPVTIIGAFAFMPAMGFSINLLTLLGLVLAIGIVVDDAIVIVENAAHHIEKGLSPREATIQAMSEVTGPVIAITLVLMAVFLPVVFLRGITGELYQQFALTIAATALISAINALTLKPAQCASWLRPLPERRSWPVRAFNAVYGRFESLYVWIVRKILRVWWLMLIVFIGIATGTAYWYQTLPTGFLPTEDQGYVIVAIQLPDAASLDRTEKVIDRINTVLHETEGVENYFAIGGFSLLEGTNTPNAATMFITWKDWSERKHPSLSQAALVDKLRGRFSEFRDAIIIVLIPPSIRGLGVAGGFEMRIEDREGVGLAELQRRTEAMVNAARQRPEIGMVSTSFRAGVPQVYLDIDRIKCEKLGVPTTALFNTLQTYLGSFYVNDFNKFGRTYQVRIQADTVFRNSPEDITKLEVRNRNGKMVPLGTLLKVNERLGPNAVSRFNLYTSATINGASAPGVSSGDAIRVMEEIAEEELPASMGFDWAGIAFEEKQITGEAIWVFVLAVFMVYLVLAAQYESWILPLAVILVVPLGLLGVVSAVYLRGTDNNIYTQIGVVLIIALASKNAILIVEFARDLRSEGHSIREAAVKAARMRFRPILMTSFAFILGVVPLVWADGAGAFSRQALGTAVFGGMITGTALAVFFVPAFYVAMQTLSERLNRRRHQMELPQSHELELVTVEQDGNSHHSVIRNGATVHSAPSQITSDRA